MSHGVMSLAFEGVAPTRQSREHTYPTEQGGAARTHASNEWHACVCERVCVRAHLYRSFKCVHMCDMFPSVRDI